MTLLSHEELRNIVELEIITPVDVKDINAASIDIHLGSTILWEDKQPGTVDFSKRDPVAFNEYVMDENGYLLEPGAFILAQSREVFNLPNWLSAEYKLKSSMARIGLAYERWLVRCWLEWICADARAKEYVPESQHHYSPWGCHRADDLLPA